MKRIFLFALAFVMVLSLSACTFNDIVEFEGSDGQKYYCEYDDGITTVTNYHPYKFLSLPDYQEMVQYGDGAGLENEGIVYYIYVVDTSINADDPKAYYTAEFDGETKELLCEEGDYFSDETQKSALIERLLNVIDSRK